MQCPCRSDIHLLNLVLGTWNVISLLGKKPVLVRKIPNSHNRAHLSAQFGFWNQTVVGTLFFILDVVQVRSRGQLGYLSPQGSLLACWSLPQ